MKMYAVCVYARADLNDNAAYIQMMLLQWPTSSPALLPHYMWTRNSSAW
jgi:hypothetical protein